MKRGSKAAGLAGHVSAAGIALSIPFLMGHGCSETKGDPCGDAERTEAVFEVDGSCGPAGLITVSARAGSCTLSVTGDDVGLPLQGSRADVPDRDLSEGGWRLGGQRGDEYVQCDVGAAGSGLTAECGGEDGSHCTAQLRSVEE